MSIRKTTKKAFSLIEISIVIVIIGILIAGITQGSRLLKASKISSAQSLTKGSPIASIPGLMVWFETSGGLNVEALTSATNGAEPEDGDEITSWLDVNPQLTLKKQLTPPLAANRPTYVREGINALPSIKFTVDATPADSDFLFTAVAPISSGDDTYTIVAVFTPSDDVAGNSSVVAQNAALVATTNSAAILRVNTADVIFEGSATTTNNVAVLAAANYDLSKPQIVILRVDNGAATDEDTVQFYINSNTGVDNGDKTTAGTKANLAVANSSFALGASYFAAGSADYFDGLISEVAVFDRALKKDEIESINKYLSQKYSIVLN